jgi:hypothetical protein
MLANTRDLTDKVTREQDFALEKAEPQHIMRGLRHGAMDFQDGT